MIKILELIRNGRLWVKLLILTLVVLVVTLVFLVIKPNKSKKSSTPISQEFELVKQGEENKETEELIPQVTREVTIIPTKINQITPTPITGSKVISIIPAINPTQTPTIAPTREPTPTLIPTIIPTPIILPTATPTQVVVTPSGVSLSATKAILYTGDKQQITSKVEPNEANNKAVLWSSDNNNVAVVDENGLIMGVNPGEAIITAKTSNNKTNLVRVEVKNKNEEMIDETEEQIEELEEPNIAINSITLNIKNVLLGVNKRQQVSVNFNPNDATDKSITWTSSNNNVATITNNGLITAKTLGKTTITAKTNNNKTATATITVSNGQITVVPTRTPTIIINPTKIPTVVPTGIPGTTIITPKVGADGIVISKPVVCSVNEGVYLTSQCSSENGGSTQLQPGGGCPTRTVCKNGCGVTSAAAVLRAKNLMYTGGYLMSNKDSPFRHSLNYCTWSINWTPIRNSFIKYLGEDSVPIKKAVKCSKADIKNWICQGYAVVFLMRWVDNGDGGGHYATAVAITNTGDIAMKDSSSRGKGRITYYSEYEKKISKTYSLRIDSCLPVKVIN